jgi:hypothetical protein
MGHWGVKSYENDDAADALDAAFEHVHGARYDELMDDRNPLSFDQVQKKLANTETLAAAVERLSTSIGVPRDDWDESARLAFAGIIVRHAELGVAIRDDWRRQAIDWLEQEAIDWDEATARRMRRQKELSTLARLADDAR